MAKKKAKGPAKPVRKSSAKPRRTARLWAGPAFFTQLCGWVDKPEEVKQTRETSENWFPSFAAAAPDVRLEDDNFPDTFLWDAELAVLGKLLPAFHQTLGTCVSQGWGRAIQDLLLQAIMLGETSEVWHGLVATEPLYVGSRIEVGGGRLGNSQGSIGAWMAKFIQQWGFLLRLKYGQFDFRTPNDNWAQQYGSSSGGLPPELEAIARRHPVRYVAPVTTAPELRASISKMRRPVPVCSNQGFTNTRDAEGFDHPNGVWNHCMVWRGYFRARGGPKGREAFVCQQSWGNQPTGPNKIYLHSGRVVELPEGCFAVDWAVADRMLRQGDSFTVADAEGFRARRVKGEMMA